MENPNSPVHNISTGTNTDFDEVTSINDIEKIYYLLYAGQNGYYIDNANTLLIMEKFVEIINNSADWISLDSEQDTISAGNSKDLKVTLNADYLEAGNYSARINIQSNDPENSLSKIPVKLNVIAASDISIEEDTVVFDTTFVTTEQNKSVIIQNNGVLPLDISLSSNSGVYTLSDNNFSIAEGKNDTLTITFTPDSENDFSAKITLLTNDPDTPEDSIILFGVGLTPPEISINPDSLYATLDSGDSTELTLNIANVGANKLEYSIYKEYYTATKNQKSKIGFYADETRDSGIKLNLENLKSKDSELINLNNIDTVEFNQYCTGLKIIGDQLVSVDYVDETLIFYDLNTFEVENSFGIHDYPYGITYDGQYIWIGNENGNFYAYGLDGNQYGSFSAPISDLNSIEFNGTNFIVTALFDTDKNVYEIDYSGNLVNTFTNDLVYHITGLSKISGSVNKYWGIYYIETNSYAVKFDLASGNIQIIDSITLPSSAYYNTENNSNVLFTAPFGDTKLYLSSINSEGNGDWLNYSPESGTVLSGNNTDITVALNASGMYDGTYYGNLFIESNDPANEQSRVPVTLTVIGYPELEISTDTLLFNTIYVGETQTNYFTITNTGTKQVNISPITFTSNNFEVGTTFPELILPGESETIIINFAPQEAGNLEEVLNIQSDATINSSLSLRLIGNAIEPPVINISTDTLYVSANLGEDCSSSFTIENLGLGTLEYNITEDSVNSSSYFWESSLESENIEYNWTDISTAGELISLYNDSYETKTLPFNFTFYGEVKNTIYISSNGYISFNSNYATSDSYQDLPNTYAPNDLLAAYWRDLFPSGDDIFYYATESEVIVQYNNINGNTFQIILNSDNTILFQYLTVNGYYNSTGIENSDGTEGVSICFNQGYLTDEMAILFYKNFEIENINPTSGNLDYNENETIYLDFNTSNLQEGTFYKNILINSNDPQKNQVILPIKIVVTKVNRAPYLISNIPTQNLLKDTTHYINLNDYFADPDGDELNYTANSSVENLVNLNLLDNLLFITVLNYGSTNISVNASDGSLNINSAFEVIVENNTGIDNIENNPFVIYPNPSSGIINIKFNSQTSDGYMLEILDLSGKILLERIIYDNEPINIKCLPKGLKIVKLQVDKKLYIDKLLIN